MPSASTILIKGSDVPSKTPALSSLEFKELAINFADGILFAKKANDSLLSFLNSNQIPLKLDESLSSVNTQHNTNTIQGNFCTILNGSNNSISANNVGILGGTNNISSHNNSFILGSNISTHNENYTYVNNLSSTNNIEPEHLILKSPNGTRWRVTVTDNGQLSAIQA